MEKLPFYWYDCVIFVATLLISVSIGLYFGCFGTRQSTVNEYLMGNKKMKIIPVALSLAVSHFSGITLNSLPADVYKYGALYLWSTLSYILLVIITAYIYLPVFWNLNVTSIYEYLEKRFDRNTKLFVSFLYILAETLYTPLIVYVPAMALSSATGIDVHILFIVICAVCVFYTAIGGLKTVIWTDLFQLAVIIIVLVIIYVDGVNSERFVPIWNKAVDGGRLDIFDFDIDPTKRDSFWIYFIGLTAHMVYYVSLSQSGAQKFLTLPSFTACVWSLVICVITITAVNVLCIGIGLLMYAKYSECDPVLSNHIDRHDQMVTYYIIGVTENIPGISGSFLATIVCGSISTFSCSLNAMSGVLYKDFVSKFLSKHISERKAINILKLIVVINGITCIAVVMVLEHMGEMFSLAVSLIGITAGPSMGLFTLGVLFPRANAKGAFLGALGGFIAIASIGVPVKYYNYQKMFTYPSKRLSTSGCVGNGSVTNVTVNPKSSSNILTSDSSQNMQVPSIFRVSFFYYCFIGAAITIILGLIISYMTKKDDHVVDEMLVHPVVRFLVPKNSKKHEQDSQQLMESK